jgi:hypothetical protein
MSNTLTDINKKYNDETYPVFPFISKNRITILPAGLYRKHKATYRGVTATYDPDTQRYTYPLYGMYNIEEDLIIVPEDLVITRSKRLLLDFHLNQGFKQVSTAPKFKTFFFEPDTPEAILALANKIEHQTKERSSDQEIETQPEEFKYQDEVDNLLNNF